MRLDIDNEQYGKYVGMKAPASALGRDMLCSFFIGGAICAVGEVLRVLFSDVMAKTEAAAAVSATMVFIGVLLTAVGVYSRLAKYGGAGTLVPITGFSNSIAAPAIEFKTEGLIIGTCAKMFVIAGPVLVCGVSASIIYGLILYIAGIK